MVIRITMTEVECFDPLTNEWTLSKALPESRSMNDDDDDDDDEDDGGDGDDYNFAKIVCLD